LGSRLPPWRRLLENQLPITARAERLPLAFLRRHNNCPTAPPVLRLYSIVQAVLKMPGHPVKPGHVDCTATCLSHRGPSMTAVTRRIGDVQLAQRRTVAASAGSARAKSLSQCARRTTRRRSTTLRNVVSESTTLHQTEASRGSVFQAVGQFNRLQFATAPRARERHHGLCHGPYTGPILRDDLRRHRVPVLVQCVNSLHHLTAAPAMCRCTLTHYHRARGNGGGEKVMDTGVVVVGVGAPAALGHWVCARGATPGKP
jgi:hypothetical protein